jgi:hypothetical protein
MIASSQVVHVCHRTNIGYRSSRLRLAQLAHIDRQCLRLYNLRIYSSSSDSP